MHNSKEEIKTPWHILSSEEIFTKLNTKTSGLSEEEISERLSTFGPNLLTESENISPMKLFLQQFNNYLIIILLFAVFLSAFVGEFVDAVVIAVIIFFAAGLGFMQEYRSEKAIQELMAMAAPTATVIRSGKQLEVPSEDVVPGDIIPISMGDKIPADARLIESINLQTNESSLTGESVSVDKNTNAELDVSVAIGNRETMVYTGTVVTYGRGTAVVVSTGMDTEFGKIAGLLSSVDSGDTPLQRNLDQLGKSLAKVSFGFIFILFILGVLEGNNPLDMFIWAIALAIAVVPEALPAVVTISLALGVQRMSKRNALIRKLPAVETLGSTSVICSDKTGTLTKGEMSVRKLFLCGKLENFNPKDNIKKKFNEKEAELLFLGSALCNDTKIERDSSGNKFIGTPTEIALHILSSYVYSFDDKKLRYPRVNEIPFTSERKMMTTINKSNGDFLVFSKGAPEVILSKCHQFMECSNISYITHEKSVYLAKTIEKMAEHGLRTIAVAYKVVDKNYAIEEIEDNLIFLGFIGLSDPPRAGVKEAVQECKTAGIKTVMITGDHMTTAIAIAQELNIINGGKTLTGLDIDVLTDNQLDSIINDIDVFARVAPAHKLRVVESFSRSGKIVAMTGDGINDAPALKRADVVIAMGIKVTAVTKESADMILTDDNFISIVGAIEEGRIMFSNIKKYLMYLLSSNLGEILLLGIAVLLGLELPLIAIQILYVNLATDGLPALALAVDPPEEDFMKQPPRNTHKNIFSKPVVFLMTIGGIWSATINLSIFVIMYYIVKVPLAEAQSMVFLGLIIIQFFKAYNYRSDHKSILHYGLFTNKWLNFAIVWELFLLISILYVPFLQTVFNTYNLSLIEFSSVILCALTIIPILEFGKYFVRRQMTKELSSLAL